MTENTAQLEALRAAHHRMLEALYDLVPIVRREADLGDPEAVLVLDEFDRAQMALQAENISAHTYLEEATHG